MTTKTVNKLPVPGATLHYEVTGTGPILLLIAGGFTDGGVFDSIVGQLAADYTVVTYDPRGNSRSPYDAQRARPTSQPPRSQVVATAEHSRSETVPADARSTDPRPAGPRPQVVATDELPQAVPAHPHDERIDQSAEDALALIDAVGGGEPAYVFGSSSGAITGLN